jgi:transcriptional regulator with XRE-family HTH domain
MLSLFDEAEYKMRFISHGRMIDLVQGPRLKKKRKELDLKAVEVAKMIDVDASMIVHVEAQRKNLSPEKAALLCQRLDIDFVWYFTGVEGPSGKKV